MMTKRPPRSEPWFRVWITVYERWRPRRWSDVPPKARAVEPADERCLSAAEARRFVEGFNRDMLRRAARARIVRTVGEQRWAVAIPVRLRIDGDSRRGRTLTRPALRRLFQAAG